MVSWLGLENGVTAWNGMFGTVIGALVSDFKRLTIF